MAHLGGELEHLAKGSARVPLPPRRGPDRVADVPALLEEDVGQLVPEGDRAEVGVALDDPQVGARDEVRRPRRLGQLVGAASLHQAPEGVGVLEPLAGEVQPGEARRRVGRQLQLAVPVTVRPGALVERLEVGVLVAGVGSHDLGHGGTLCRSCPTM